MPSKCRPVRPAPPAPPSLRHFDCFTCAEDLLSCRYINYCVTKLHCINCLYQARREPQRGPGKHYRGALSPPFSRSRRRGRREGGTWGEVFPHHPTRGSGKRRRLPQRGPGRSPCRKWILCIFQVRKKPPGTPFSVFLSDSGAPQTSRGPGKLPPPSRRAWFVLCT